MLQRKQVLNWINDHLLFSFSCSITFLSFPVHLGDCSRLMGLSPRGLREWSLFSCLWPRPGWCSYSSSWLLQTTLYLAFPISHRFFPWSDPKHCCQNLVRIHPVTRLWLSLVSEHRLPASWHAVFWSPSLLGSTYQQCQMCCRRGLSLGLSPALAFPSASASSPKPARPFLATSSLRCGEECFCA